MSSDNSSRQSASGPGSGSGDTLPLELISDFIYDNGSVQRTYRFVYNPPSPCFVFEHDKEKRLFVLRWDDGRVEKFRDNPTRHLVVEPDPATGAMRPAIKRGLPSFIRLCREEREL